MRVCDVCKFKMLDGFLIDEREYYCCEECLHQNYTDEEYQELYEQDWGFWTEWEATHEDNNYADEEIKRDYISVNRNVNSGRIYLENETIEPGANCETIKMCRTDMVKILGILWDINSINWID